MTDSRFYTSHGNAGLGRRAAAVFIDTLIILLIGGTIALLLYYVLSLAIDDRVAVLPANGTLMILYLGYFILLEARDGTTIGKKLLGLKVVGRQGQPVTMRESLARNGLRIIDGFPGFFAPGLIPVYLAGGVIAMYSDDRQRLGDIAADTVVIKISTDSN